MKETTAIEIHAMIGLFICKGLYKLDTFRIARLFWKRYEPPIFSATMSRNSFFSFSHTLRLTVKKPVLNRRKQDRFAAARKLLELFNEQCLKSLRACGYLYTDETLYRTRNQISFKQFNPNKPVKYGLLFKSINAARYPYPLHICNSTLHRETTK